jgi:hypothetical protein
MVQRAVKFFADPRSIQTDMQKRDLIRLFVGFEEVAARGLIEPDGQKLASDFLKYAHEWIKNTPKLAALYQELRKK